MLHHPQRRRFPIHERTRSRTPQTRRICSPARLEPDCGVLVAGLVVLAIGENPLFVVKTMLYGALGYPEGFGYTLYFTTNFMFTGLSVAVAYHAGLFNIGPEGQATFAGIGTVLVALALDGWPWWAVLPLAVVAAAAFGAAWAFIPAYLQAKRGSHIVITTIMFNFLAATLIVYLLVNVMGKPGSMEVATREISDATRLPLFSSLFAKFGINLGAAPVNGTFLLAILASIGVWLLIWHTRLGYEIRTVGTNPTAAAYAGINPKRIIIIAMLISGGLSGLLAVNEVMSVQGRLLQDVAQGAGFVGIAVALMGARIRSALRLPPSCSASSIRAVPNFPSIHRRSRAI